MVYSISYIHVQTLQNMSSAIPLRLGRSTQNVRSSCLRCGRWGSALNAVISRAAKSQKDVLLLYSKGPKVIVGFVPQGHSFDSLPTGLRFRVSHKLHTGVGLYSGQFLLNAVS